MKTSGKILSLVLILAIFFTSFPIQSMALGINLDYQQANEEVVPPSTENPDKINNEETPSAIIGEDFEKREESVKHFIKEDFTFEAAVYPYPVHYLDNGIWKDIDNTLSEQLSEENEEVLSNKNNSFKLKIAKNSNSKKLVSISKDKYNLSWNIVNPQKTTAKVTKASDESLKDVSSNEKAKSLTKLGSVVDFIEIYPNVDLQYEIISTKIKENIILKQRIDNPEFSFNLQVNKLAAKLLEDNTIVFYDENDEDNQVFKMEAPFMYDANGEESLSIELSLEKTKEGYTFTVKPDKKWLDSEERAYPVVLDPPVETSLKRSEIFDTHVSEGYPTSNFINSYLLRIGNGSATKINRAFISFTLPTLTSGDNITQAVLTKYLFNPYSSGSQINVHEVTGSWETNEISWGKKPTYNPKIEDYVITNGIGYYQWDVTSIVKKWYTDGTGNNGLMLKHNVESSSIIDFNEFYSSDTSDAYMAQRPSVVLWYTNNSGMENYWTYHSQNVGRAGTSYINDYSGNYIFVHSDVSTNGNRMPVAINHIFNSTERGKNIGYGNGWRLNINQTIIPKVISNIQYYIYTDEDGTKHYFKADKDGIIKDESGLDLTLAINPNNSYTIQDKKDNKLNFVILDGSQTRYLKYIKDNNENLATIFYEGIKPSSITDGVGRKITLNYGTDGNLISIVDPSNKSIKFEYTPKPTGLTLTKITYPDNKYSSYNYTDSSNMTSAVNFDGYKVGISYHTDAPYRVKTIKESHITEDINAQGSSINEVLGEELNINYKHNVTEFTDARGRKNIFHFNNSGNTVSITDNNGNAQYYQYGNGTNVNKLTLESKLQRTIINHLQNHNAEVTGYWTPYSSADSSGSIFYDTANNAYLGKQSLALRKDNNLGIKYHQQRLTLEKGKTYTFSGYVKTNNVSNTNGKGAQIYIGYQDSKAAWIKVESEFINGTTDWQRVEFKFTLPADALTNNVDAKVALDGETGTAYFDALQLEEGTLANRYNLIENPNFTYGTDIPTFWNKGSHIESGDSIELLSDNDYPKNLDKKAFRMNGSSSKKKYIYQSVNISGGENDVLVLGGWAKGDSIPREIGTDKGVFMMDIGLVSDEGAVVQWQNVILNNDSSDWQYAANRIVANQSYSKVNIYLMYYNNANTAYFDGIQLYKEEFGQSYQYDDKGNVVSTTDLTSQESQFRYENNSDLIEIIDPNDPGSIFTYGYDDNHNLLDATSAQGVKYSFTYDDYGNPLTTEIGKPATQPDSEGKTIKSSASYTEDGNYIKTLTDPLGKVISYNYNETKGILNSVTDPKGYTTNYSYDANTDALTDVYKTVNGEEIRNSYSYENDRLERVTHNGFSYSFNYNSFGSPTQVKVGDQALITNTFEDRTGKLLESTYGNGHKVSNDYDMMDRVTAKRYNGNIRYKFEYDAGGKLGYQEDLVNGINYRYIYDLSDRLVKVKDTLGNTTNYKYDENNISKFIEEIKGKKYTTGFAYDKDDRQTSITYDQVAVKYEYDTELGRLNSSNVDINGARKFNTTYDYLAGFNGSYTNTLKSISNNGNVVSYTYDDNGNIETITENGKVIKYYYDELNQLIREDNEVLNKTIVYSYDKGGNITSKVEYGYTTTTPSNPIRTYSYGYTDTNWKDKLTSFDGRNITYDAIGNPLNDGIYTYTWEEGRQLASMSKTGQNISFKYNSEGIRTEKTVNGVTTKYHLVGDKVTYETNGIDTIYYRYDSEGNLLSMKLNESEYFYIRNGQGDITGLFDSNGTQVVSYSYDSWGKLVSIEGSLKDTVGQKNPYRYRGYRYDTETGLYYLQSRYYNPEWSRFINADEFGGEIGTLLSHNLFAYCVNNPVNMEDSNGYWPSLGQIFNAGKNLAKKAVDNIVITATAVVITVALAVGITYVVKNPQKVAKVVSGGTAGTSAQRMENARKLGEQGEKAAKIVKNTKRIESLTKTAKYRIPDALNETTLTEIKNVKYQGLTNQIRDFSFWAEQEGLNFVLKTRPDTKISGPLQNYIDKGKIIHLFIGD